MIFKHLKTESTDRGICEFARTIPDDPGESSRRVMIRISDFDPYFFIHERETQRAEKMRQEFDSQEDPEVEITGIDRGHESIDGVPLTRIQVSHPREVHRIRDEFESHGDTDVETWESDIPYVQRFKVDTGIKDFFEIPDTMLESVNDTEYRAPWIGITPLESEDDRPVNNCYFDIEVAAEDQPTPEDESLDTIVTITQIESLTERLVSWEYHPDNERETDWDVWTHPEVPEVLSWEIRRWNDEAQMLIDFFTYHLESDIDVLSGWYSDKFDVPYVLRRAEELGIDSSMWSQIRQVNDGVPLDEWGQAKIGGVFMNDLERRYSNIKSPNQSGLEYVASQAEDIMSWEQESSDIMSLWENDRPRLLRYNANDVVATWLVDESSGISDFYLEKMYMTGCEPEQIEQDSKVITYYLLYEADWDERIPRAKIRTHKEFGGGRVILPDTQGVQGPIAVLDLSKIYPSIMITLGLSYENTPGVDPVRFHDSLSLSDEMPRQAWDQLTECIRSLADVKAKDSDDVEIEWQFEPGDVISPLALGKDGRKEIWDQIYDMDSEGNLSRTLDWEFISPEDQVTLDEVVDMSSSEVDKVRSQIEDGHDLDEIMVGDVSLTDVLDGRVLEEVHIPSDHTVDRDRDGERLPNGVRVDRDNEGIISRTLVEMFKLRYRFGDAREALDPEDPDYNDLYEELTQKRQNMKDQINAVFGYTGYKKSPLFRPEVAMTTTFVGRYILKVCEEVANDMGYEVIYGDSVTGDTEIRVNDQSLTVEEFWDALEDLPDVGDEKQVKDVTGGDFGTVSVSPNGEVTEDTIDSVIRHRVEKDIFEVELENGESLRVTEDHSLLRTNGNGVEEVTPKEASDTDSMLVYDGDVSDLRQGLHGDRRETSRGSRHDDGRVRGAVPEQFSSRRVVQGEEKGDSSRESGQGRQRQSDRIVRGDGGSVVGRRLPGIDGGGQQRGSRGERSPRMEPGNVFGRDEREDGNREVRRMATKAKRIATQILRDESRGQETTRREIYESTIGVGERFGEDGTPDASGRNQSFDRDRTESDGGSLQSRLQSERYTRLCGWVFLALMSSSSSESGLGGGLEEREERPDSEREVDTDGSSVHQVVGASDQGRSRHYEETSGAEVVGIESIERVDTDSEWVYDLDVRYNSTFLANGIFVHNTDSVMVHLDGYDWDEDSQSVIDEGMRVEERANSALDDFAENFCGVGRDEHMFELEFEKCYSRYFQGDKKKRYAGLKVWNEDAGRQKPKIDVTGFEYVRGDSSVVTGELQMAMFEAILRQDADQDEIVDIVDDFYQRVCDGEVPALEACRAPSVKSSPDDYVQVPIAARAGFFTDRFFRDVDVSGGDDVAYVYVDSTGYNHEGKPLPDSDVIGIVEDMEPPQAQIECRECGHEWTENQWTSQIKAHSSCPGCGHDRDNTIGQDDPFWIDGCRADWEKIADKNVKSKAEKLLGYLGWEDVLGGLGGQDTF